VPAFGDNGWLAVNIASQSLLAAVYGVYANFTPMKSVLFQVRWPAIRALEVNTASREIRPCRLTQKCRAHMNATNCPKALKRQVFQLFPFRFFSVGLHNSNVNEAASPSVF
jgi:hypothetical protein